METLKKHLRNYLKNHHMLRILVRKSYGRYKEHKYRKTAAKIEIDEKMVLFETFMGRQYGDNPRAIYEHMIRDARFDDYKLVWTLIEPAKAEEFQTLDRAQIVEMKSKDYFRCCAQAKYIVTNSNLDNRVIKKKDQIFLQTWHGTPLKKLRCDIEALEGNVNNTLEEIRFKNDVDVIRYDYFISPSEFASEKFKSAFNLKNLGIEDIVVETGYPRNDMMFTYTKEFCDSVRRDLDIPACKKIILYAPTFRDNMHDGAGYVYDMHLDFDILRQELGDEYVVLFRAHYFVANQFDFEKYKGFVYDVSALYDITPLYTISDLLITDYSSVFFDYANLRRPIIFYMYDLQEYADSIRGFYIDIEELPGPIIQQEAKLPGAIKTAMSGNFVPDRKYSDFNAKYNNLDDGNASRRVVDLLFKDRVE